MRVERVCRVCGRAVGWRRKWMSGWDSIQYCSDTCRSRGLTRRDLDVEQAILVVLEQQAADTSVSPSDVARSLKAGDEYRAEDDRAEMERIRLAARRLQRAGRIHILHKGRTVDPSRVNGPVRLKLRQFGAIQA